MCLHLSMCDRTLGGVECGPHAHCSPSLHVYYHCRVSCQKSLSLSLHRGQIAPLSRFLLCGGNANEEGRYKITAFAVAAEKLPGCSLCKRFCLTSDTQLRMRPKKGPFAKMERSGRESRPCLLKTVSGQSWPDTASSRAAASWSVTRTLLLFLLFLLLLACIF